MPIIHPELPSDGDDAVVAPYNDAINAILGVLDGAVDSDNIADNSIITSKLHDAAVTNVKVADNSINISTKASSFSGWVGITDTWAYASATTITVPTDATTKYDVGDYIMFTNNGSVKYFRVNIVAATVLTLFGINGAVVENFTISAISYSKVSYPHAFPTTGLDWWQEVGRTTLIAAGSTITITGIAAKKYLKIVGWLPDNGSAVTGSLTFNNDTGSNYAQINSTAGATDTALTSQSSLVVAVDSAATPRYFEIELVNTSAKEKLFQGHTISQSTAGAANAPVRREINGKWTNTSAQITRMDVITSTANNFAIGAEVIVLGHD